MTTATNPTKPIFDALGSSLLLDAEGPAFALLGNFLANVKANPTTQNVLAQGAILAASAPLQLPNLEQGAITSLAEAGEALLALAQASIPKAA